MEFYLMICAYISIVILITWTISIIEHFKSKNKWKVETDDIDNF